MERPTKKVKSKVMQTRITDELQVDLFIVAKELGMDEAALVRTAVEEFVERYKNKPIQKSQGVPNVKRRWRSVIS